MNHRRDRVRAWLIVTTLVYTVLCGGHAYAEDGLALKVIARSDGDPLSRQSPNVPYPPSIRVRVLPTANTGETLEKLSACLSELAAVGQNDWFALMVDDGGVPEANAIKVAVQGFAGSGRQMPKVDAAALANALAAFLKVDASLSPEKRAEGLKEKTAEYNQLALEAHILEAISKSSPQRGEQLSDRLSSWRSEDRSLKETQQSRQARLAALASERDRLMSQADTLKQQDPVVRQMQKIVDLRQQRLDDTDARNKAGQASSTDLSDARIALAEAELRLAERQAALSSPGAIASLEQINQEISKLSVESAVDLQRLAELRQRLAPFDLSAPTTQSLSKAAGAMQEDPTTRRAWAMKADLDQKLNALRTELLRLKIVSIEPINP